MKPVTSFDTIYVRWEMILNYAIFQVRVERGLNGELVLTKTCLAIIFERNKLESFYKQQQQRLPGYGYTIRQRLDYAAILFLHGKINFTSSKKTICWLSENIWWCWTRLSGAGDSNNQPIFDGQATTRATTAIIRTLRNKTKIDDNRLGNFE